MRPASRSPLGLAPLTLAALALWGAALTGPAAGHAATFCEEGYRYAAGAIGGGYLGAHEQVIADKCPPTRLTQAMKLPQLSARFNPDTGSLPEPAAPADPGPAPVGKGVPHAEVAIAQAGAPLATVHFALDSARISQKGLAQLEQLVKQLKTGQVPAPVDVVGYTCDLGTRAHNDRLAKSRAQAVASWLKRHGVTVASAAGQGKCCYATPAGPRSLNRRAEVRPAAGAPVGTRTGTAPTIKPLSGDR